MTSGSLKIIKAAMLGNPKKQQTKQPVPPAKVPKLGLFIIFFVTLTTTILFSSFFSSYTQGFAHSQNQNVTPSENATSINSDTEKQTIPIRLKIPAISVDAPIEHVGLTPEGAMDVPTQTTNVGWFNLGPKPGVKGSSVLAGHSNNKDGTPGVFNSLDKLKWGDVVQVEQAGGTLLTFTVKKTQIYNPGYADAVFGMSDSTYLNLITCDGIWDEQAQTYSKRLVVFAELLQ